MSTPRIQMSFRVDEALYQAIQTEATARNLSVQDLIIAALIRYFERYDAKDRVCALDDALSATISRQVELTLWEKYLERMPAEKIEVATSAMQWDLQMQNSARRNEAKSKAKPSGVRRVVRPVGESRIVQPEKK